MAVIDNRTAQIRLLFFGLVVTRAYVVVSLDGVHFAWEHHPATAAAGCREKKERKKGSDLSGKKNVSDTKESFKKTCCYVNKIRIDTKLGRRTGLRLL